MIRPGPPAGTSQAFWAQFIHLCMWVSMIHDEQMKDISGKVDLNPFLHLYWLDALGEFASSARLRTGFSYVVTIDDERWYINAAGDLVISASIEPDTIRMVIPRGLWEWL